MKIYNFCRNAFTIMCLITLIFCTSSIHAKSIGTQASPLVWLLPVLHKSFNLNYYTYRNQLRENTVNYTSSGWGIYSTLLQQAHILEKIEAQKTSSELEILSDPEIILHRKKDNIDVWEVQLIVALTYSQKDLPRFLRGALKVSIIDAPHQNDGHGFAIDDIVFTPQKLPNE